MKITFALVIAAPFGLEDLTHLKGQLVFRKPIDRDFHLPLPFNP